MHVQWFVRLDNQCPSPTGLNHRKEHSLGKRRMWRALGQNISGTGGWMVIWCPIARKWCPSSQNHSRTSFSMQWSRVLPIAPHLHSRDLNIHQAGSRLQ